MKTKAVNSLAKPARKLGISVTWTEGARAAVESLHAREAEDAARERRAWAASLRRAARACVASVPPEGEATAWARRYQNCAWSVDATFVCDEEMREMNARFRAKDRPTDVLSFSQIESASIESASIESASLDDIENPSGDSSGENEIKWPGAQDEGAQATLGDLVIAVETAHRQALERAHAGEVEVLFLAIHGTLHLLGYDHGTSSQRRVMWREQDALFERLNKSRDKSGDARTEVEVTESIETPQVLGGGA